MTAISPRRRLWTVGDVAAFAKVSQRTVRGRLDDGTIPSLRFGGVVRFDPKAIVEALQRSDS